MKKFISLVIMVSILLGITPIYVFAAQSTTKIAIDGEIVEFNSSTGYPFIDNNSRTQVPFRVTLEKFGARLIGNIVQELQLLRRMA